MKEWVVGSNCLKRLLEQVTVNFNEQMYTFIFRLCCSVHVNVGTAIHMYVTYQAYTVCSIHEHNAALNQGFSLLLIT